MDAAARRMLGLVEAALAVTVWGASFVATKIAVAEISPPALVWIRFTMGLVFLAVTTAIRGELAWPRRREVGYFALLGFIGIALHQWLQSDSLLTSNAATVSWLAASSPVFMMLLARIFLGEQLGATGVVAAAIALGGVALVVTAGDLGRLRIPAVRRPGADRGAELGRLLGPLALGPAPPPARSDDAVRHGHRFADAARLLPTREPPLGGPTPSARLAHQLGPRPSLAPGQVRSTVTPPIVLRSRPT